MGYPGFEFSLGISGLEMVGQTDGILSIRNRLSVVFFWLSFVLLVHYVPRDLIYDTGIGGGDPYRDHWV